MGLGSSAAHRAADRIQTQKSAVALRSNKTLSTPSGGASQIDRAFVFGTPRQGARSPRKQRRRLSSTFADAESEVESASFGKATVGGRHLGCGVSRFPSRGAARGGPQGAADASLSRWRERGAVSFLKLLPAARVSKPGSRRSRDRRRSSGSGRGKALVTSDRGKRRW